MRRRGCGGRPTTAHPGGGCIPDASGTVAGSGMRERRDLTYRHAPAIGPGDPDSGSGADVGSRRNRGPTPEGGTETRGTPGGAPGATFAKTSPADAAGSPRAARDPAEASSRFHPAGRSRPPTDPKIPRSPRQAWNPEGSLRPSGPSNPRREGGWSDRKPRGAQRHLSLPKRQLRPAGGPSCLTRLSDHVGR